MCLCASAELQHYTYTVHISLHHHLQNRQSLSLSLCLHLTLRCVLLDLITNVQAKHYTLLALVFQSCSQLKHLLCCYVWFKTVKQNLGVDGSVSGQPFILSNSVIWQLKSNFAPKCFMLKANVSLACLCAVYSAPGCSFKTWRIFNIYNNSIYLILFYFLRLQPKIYCEEKLNIKTQHKQRQKRQRRSQ